MFRVSQSVRRTELFPFLICLICSLILLVLPDDEQITVADDLRLVLTDPYLRVRNFAADVTRIRRENEWLQARVAELELQASAVARRPGDRTRLTSTADLAFGVDGHLLPCEVMARRRGRFARMIQIRSAAPAD